MKDLYEAVRKHRQEHPVDHLYTPSVVDELALTIANEILSAIPRELVGSVNTWSQARAVIQSKVAIVIRHTAYDPPSFPGDGE